MGRGIKASGGWQAEDGGCGLSWVERALPTGSGCGTAVQTQPREVWAECGQDYQLHMSRFQAKACQQVGLDLVMIRAENIPFLKKKRSLKKGNKRVKNKILLADSTITHTCDGSRDSH